MVAKAESAAERATVLEPRWAKGWWRRGVVAALQRELVKSAKYHQKGELVTVSYY